MAKDGAACKATVWAERVPEPHVKQGCDARSSPCCLQTCWLGGPTAACAGCLTCQSGWAGQMAATPAPGCTRSSAQHSRDRRQRWRQ